MRWQLPVCFSLLSIAFLALATIALCPTAVLAQEDDVVVEQMAGVAVDPEGVLRKQVFSDPGGRLMRERAASAKSTLNQDVANFSKLRKISLNRLEKALKGRQGVPTDEMRNLAGLQRVKYVFYYPETNDIVLAGPAEGWLTDLSGRVVGITSRRPTIELQDLVVALRAFPPDKEGASLIGCSIDPTQEGLAAMQRFLRSVGVHATPGQTQYIVDGIRTSLGKQVVSIDGVPANTHFAQVLVEADYRMKLIGIGLEKPTVRLASYVDRVNPSHVTRNAMQRWYFVPDYNCVRMSEDGLAMELVGDGVKLVGEDEAVSADGVRRTASRGSRASEAFVKSFTRKYSVLAERSPVYAQLRNLIDLSVAAAYIQKEDFYGQSGWKMKFFGDENAFSVEMFKTPSHVATAVTARWKGNRLMTPVGGGVSIEPERALDTDNLLADKDGKVARLHKETKINLTEGQWWWD